MPRRAKIKAAKSGSNSPQRSLRPRRAATDNAKNSDLPAESSEKMASHAANPAASRATTKRASKKWSEPFVTTSEKSPLVNIDLVKLLAKPEAWNCLEEDEKREILSLLPPDVHPNPDGDPEDANFKLEPLPQEFLRYSIPWRDAVRQFQADLENGKYDPEWQRQAHQAMQERADGKFDAWKEEQFEEFWGQKQKIDSGLIAGESSKIKLETLVQHNLIQVGDVWKYARVFGKQKEKVFIEKEVKIIGRDGNTLTFSIPPGRRVLLCGVIDCSETKDSSNTPPKLASIDNPFLDDETSSATEMDTGSPFPRHIDVNNGSPQELLQSGNLVRSLNEFIVGIEGNSETLIPSADTPPKTDTTKATINTKMKTVPSSTASFCLTHDSIAVPGAANFPESCEEDSFSSCSEISDIESNFNLDDIDLSWDIYRFNLSSNMGASGRDSTDGRNCTHARPNTTKDRSENISAGLMKTEHSTPENINESIKYSSSSRDKNTILNRAQSKVDTTNTREAFPRPSEQPMKDIVLSGVRGPGALENKILRTDGRMTNPPNGNAWKDFRCFRNNQDMGSLWEIRQAWYLRTR
ncbi:hypothetical protein LOZ53_000498 [Ophidiomyces ophidiicola]|nr:hypothetical protein LOZ55_000834 [Ophidiomyces ophidiicola]KAI1992377.1 hypothetical protein LOZ54_001726 [Ophidiomyces ophidiicola]KAI1997491.1 hypothetical protein LOZ53_000498 [Ophidiomyces ophidiicola]KAI1998004.1 hypothetical protein LOZ51_002678 [Ophidiomyces ophidiicola]